MSLRLSAADIGRLAYPWLPVRLFMHDQFDSVTRAQRLPAELQVLSLHGTLDDIAPIHLGRALFDALPVAHKRFEQLDGTGHNDVSVSDPARYLRIAAAFCERVAASQPPPPSAL